MRVNVGVSVWTMRGSKGSCCSSLEAKGSLNPSIYCAAAVLPVVAARLNVPCHEIAKRCPHIPHTSKVTQITDLDPLKPPLSPTNVYLCSAFDAIFDTIETSLRPVPVCCIGYVLWFVIG